MKMKWTLGAAAALVIVGSAVYYNETVQQKNKAEAELLSHRILTLQRPDINLVKIESDNNLVTLQKINDRWALLEPIQDDADNVYIDKIIDQVFDDKTQKVQTQDNVKLEEYGLDKPAVTITLKSANGQSQRIFVSKEKNFENMHFMKSESVNHVFIGSPIWFSSFQGPVTLFREKKLYRSPVADIQKVRIRSLNEVFNLVKNNGQWVLQENPDFVLDQNIIRAKIKELAEMSIENYLQEGEPSAKDLEKMGLKKAPVEIEFEGKQHSWQVVLNLDDKDHALYGLTSKPSFLIQLPIAKWEAFANLRSDQFRDRISIMTFNKNDVSKVYSKVDGKVTEFENAQQTWKLNSALPADSEFAPTEAEKLIDQIHELKISEFVTPEEAKSFTGQNMFILKSSSDSLVFQLNWGPLIKQKFSGVEKEVYLARTQLSQNIFAIDKVAIDQLNLERLFTKKEVKNDQN